MIDKQCSFEIKTPCPSPKSRERLVYLCAGCAVGLFCKSMFEYNDYSSKQLSNTKDTICP